MKPIRKIGVVFVTLSLFVLVDVEVAHFIEPQARSPREAVEKVTSDLIAQILARTMKWRLDLPRKVDEITSLEDIRAERNMVIYSMTTTADGSEFDRMMGDIHTHLDETSCAREDYRKLLAHGLSIAISFRSPSGKVSVPVMITPQMCGAK